MDLVPSLMTELADWPRHRALLILDEISAGRGWSVRYSPGQAQVTHPTVRHPERSVSDVVLRRTASNHYQMLRNRRWEDVPADGDCFFNALAGALGDGGPPDGLTGQNLRARVADHIDQHPQVADYVVSRRTPVQQALFEVAYPLEGILGHPAFTALTRIVNGQSYESQLASAMANTPGLIDDWPDTARQLITRRTQNRGVLPVDVMPGLEAHLVPLGLFRPAIHYLNNIANWPSDRRNRQLLSTTSTGEARLPSELLQIIAAYLPSRNPTLGVFDRDRDIRAFLDNSLLPGPDRSQGLDRLLQRFARCYIWPSNDVLYILLEYGLTVQALTDHYRAIGFDEAGDPLEPGQDEIDRFLDDYLAFFERYPGRDRNDLFADREELLSSWRGHDAGQRSVALLREGLGRFADLLARADIVLRSDVFSFHLGWSVGLEELANLIRNPRLSNARLRIISDYLETRAGEMQEREIVDTQWMRPFDDHNLRNIVARALNQHRHPADRAFSDTLLEFVAYVSEQALSDAFAMSYVTAVFTPASGRLSNSRVALLLGTPDLFTTLSGHPRAVAQTLWDLLISPEYSDETIGPALGTSVADALRDLRHFIARLRMASWGA